MTKVSVPYRSRYSLHGMWTVGRVTSAVGAVEPAIRRTSFGDCKPRIERL